MKLFLCSAFYCVLSTPLSSSFLPSSIPFSLRPRELEADSQKTGCYGKATAVIGLCFLRFCFTLLLVCFSFSFVIVYLYFFLFVVSFKYFFPLYSSVRKNLLLFVCMHVWVCFSDVRGCPYLTMCFNCFLFFEVCVIRVYTDMELPSTVRSTHVYLRYVCACVRCMCQSISIFFNRTFKSHDAYFYTFSIHL